MERNEISAKLVKQAIEGDSSAFEELYQSTYKSVFFHAQKILKNEQDVEDAVSETYVRAYENLSKLQDPALFQAWVNRIVTNLSMNMVRDGRYREGPSLDDEDFFYEPVAADADTPNMVMDRKGTEEIVGGMIDALPEVQRTTVILYYYDEMSVSAIAKAMGCSEGTVKSRLNYARKNLEQAVLAEEKRGIKLYTISPTLIFSAITLLIKSANVPLSSFMEISEIIAGLGGVAAQASGAGAAATAGGTATASGTSTATTGSTAATTVKTGASAGAKASAAAKSAAAAGGTAKGVLATKIGAGILAAAIAAGGIAIATSSPDPNKEALSTFQDYIHSEDFELSIRDEINSPVPFSFTPEEYRYAIYDVDGDGTVELYTMYETTWNQFGSDKFVWVSGRKYDSESQSVDWITDYCAASARFLYPNESMGECQIVKNGKCYSAAYEKQPQGTTTWFFSRKSMTLSGSVPDVIFDYNFEYADHIGGMMWYDGENLPVDTPVEGTSLYRTRNDRYFMEPEFELTDEEFRSLIDNCVKIIGIGPEFEGQDLSMSYDEFMALKSVDDAPQLGSSSQSSIDLAVEKAAERDFYASPTYQNAEALKAYQEFVQSESLSSAYYSQEPVDPRTCRFALCDVDGDGINELFYCYDDYAEDGKKYTIFCLCEYDRIYQSVNLKIMTPMPGSTDTIHNCSFGECRVIINEQMYKAYYWDAAGKGSWWEFMGFHNSEPGSYEYYRFSFADFNWDASEINHDCEPVEGTSLYKTVTGAFDYTEPEFTLTDGEYSTLLDNCVKIIGVGPVFEGQDLGMSYDEFMALQSVDDAPQPGKNS